MSCECLGSGDDTQVFLYSRGGRQLLAELQFDRSGNGYFTRTLDNSSEFHMSGVLSGLPDVDCCRGFEKAYQWATEIVVVRDGGVAWVGPLVSGRFDTDGVSLDATDLSAWYGRRTLGDHKYKDDLSNIWRRYHDDVLSQDSSPNINLVVYQSGVTGEREVKASDYKFAFDEMQELARTELDWTTYGRSVIVGGPDFINQTLVISEEEWETAPSVIFRGEDQATTVVVKGAEDIVGVATDARYEAYYGRLVRVFEESSIKDTASAVNAAKSRLDLLKDPVYVDPSANAVLRPSAGVCLNQLIPGSRIRLAGLSICRDAPIDYRLHTVSVSLTGEVSVQLQNIGSVDNF